MGERGDRGASLHGDARVGHVVRVDQSTMRGAPSVTINSHGCPRRCTGSRRVRPVARTVRSSPRCGPLVIVTSSARTSSATASASTMNAEYVPSGSGATDSIRSFDHVRGRGVGPRAMRPRPAWGLALPAVTRRSYDAHSGRRRRASARSLHRKSATSAPWCVRVRADNGGVVRHPDLVLMMERVSMVLDGAARMRFHFGGNDGTAEAVHEQGRARRQGR